MEPKFNKATPERRGFLSQLAAIAFGGFVGLAPLAAGLVAWLDPLRRSSGGGKLLRIADLAAIPSDGTPAQFPVVSERVDAWTRFPKQAVGSVFVRKTTDGKVVAYTATCPHAGCFVDFRSESKQFRCPCHNSSFTLEGEIIAPSPSPRGLDTLAVDETRLAQGEVWVKYQNFKTGCPTKEAKE